MFRRILSGESVFDYQTRHLRRDGSHVDLSFNAVPLRDARGEVVGATGTARDVTAEKRAAAALYENIEKLRLAVDAAELVYWEWERDTDRLHWGREPSALVGAHDEPQFALVRVPAARPSGGPRALSRRRSTRPGSGPAPARNEYRVIRHDGQVALAFIARQDACRRRRAGATRMIGVSQDITERKRQEEEARFLAYHDTLTGPAQPAAAGRPPEPGVFLAQRRDTRVARDGGRPGPTSSR